MRDKLVSKRTDRLIATSSQATPVDSLQTYAGFILKIYLDLLVFVLLACYGYLVGLSKVFLSTYPKEI